MKWKSFEEWMEQTPAYVRQSPFWSFATYGKALFLAGLAWFDGEKPLASPQGQGIGWQLGHRKKINIRDGLQAIPESRLDFV